MDHSPEDIRSGLVLFQNDFSLEPSYLALDQKDVITFDQAFLMIMRVVEDLLVKDFNGLINILYRVDVSEQKLKEALAENTDNPASIITQMIIEREIQKVATRRKYS